MEKIHILLFYKFVPISNIEVFAEKHLEICKSIGLFGKVLVANEGINGSISGTKTQTEKYKSFLKGISEFSDIIFKEEVGVLHPFEKMAVRTKKEIIRLDEEIDMNKKGKYLSPKEFLELYENKEDVIILDARNDYETKAGRFKNALTPGIKTFRQFPKAAEMLRDKKDKKIVLYCTGGIRCEKASAYLIGNGFNDVSQLEGGIITFCQKFPKTVWEGRCFVFDKRLISGVDSESEAITKCQYCSKPCDLYRNCKIAGCNVLFNLCKKCEKDSLGCCSKECFDEYKNFLLEKAMINMGRRKVLN